MRPELLIMLGRAGGLPMLPTRREQVCNCLHQIADASKHQTGSRYTRRCRRVERQAKEFGQISSKPEPSNPR